MVRTGDRIQSRFVMLEFEARPFGAIPLTGSSFYRLRSGDWRILYEIDDARRLVLISRVLRRSEKTYRGL